MSKIMELNSTICTLHNCNQDWYILKSVHGIFKICCFISWAVLSGVNGLQEPRNTSLGYIDTIWWVAVYALFYGLIAICIYSVITFFVDQQRIKLETQIKLEAQKAREYALSLTNAEIKNSELSRHLFLKLVMEIEITNPPLLKDNIDFLLYHSRMQQLYNSVVTY